MDVFHRSIHLIIKSLIVHVVMPIRIQQTNSTLKKKDPSRADPRRLPANRAWLVIHPFPYPLNIS